MKTKQAKEETEKSTEEETVAEPKTRARKKASDINDEDKQKITQDDPKPSKEPRKNAAKPKTVVKKRPLGIRKTLRNKKVVISKEKLKNVIKGAKRGRKPAVKPVETIVSLVKNEKDDIPIIPVSEIKKEPTEETSPNSRSSSPKTAGRRQRLTSDIMMMKSVLADSTSTLVVGPRTSPYSMRSERSNSPNMSEKKNLRSVKPRKVKNNLLNEVVKKEQKKRSRLLSDSKLNDSQESSEETKKLKRGRSCSRDGSEISKSSDVTESDISLSETLSTDTEIKDIKDLLKKLDKTKTDIDLDIKNSVQISTIDKVPSLMFDTTTAPKTDTETTSYKNKNKLSLKRSTSLDSDNNNDSNRLKLENLRDSVDVQGHPNIVLKTENDTLFDARSSILTSMSKTFNSKEMSKNIRKARRGRKAAAAARPAPTPGPACAPALAPAPAPAPAAASATPATSLAKPSEAAAAPDALDDKHETLESLSKEIDDLITNLDQSLDHDNNMEANNEAATPESSASIESAQTKSAAKFYGVSKPLCDNNSIIGSSDAVLNEKETVVPEGTPSKSDDSENIRLHFDGESAEKSVQQNKRDITYKCNVASIDKLMDRLKVFEEFDKRRQRQEKEIKTIDSKQVMVSSDVVLINKSGADFKPFKDMTVRSPEKPMEKENVLSCFENNSAISIVKRDQVRKSIDVDFPNSLTLIKRNSISRKESTGSNNSRESNDAISIFEKSLGKDVTLTEIRKSVDKSASSAQVELHQFATLHPNNPNQSLVGVVLDSKQVSLTPRVSADTKPQEVSKRRSRESSRKSSETAAAETETMATIKKIKGPGPSVKSPPPAITPLAIKSPEMPAVDLEPVAPLLETKISPETASAPKVGGIETKVDIAKIPYQKIESASCSNADPLTNIAKIDIETHVENKVVDDVTASEDMVVDMKPAAPELVEPEPQPGPSSELLETPESQKRKENVLRTLGLLTHKAAKEAKIEKLKEKERIYGGIMHKKSAKASTGDYTGTLKTVIKLNRGTGERDKKKYRSSLKMTFQKSKHRGKPALEPGDAPSDDDAYYTIERREGGAAACDGGHRKSYSNRLNNHEAGIASTSRPTEAEAEAEVAAEAAEVAPRLVIPEKASSFSIHPGRLCQDQCFYCGGKFGLFDTPCHIAQMKSAERQKKVLSNEEKLTIDSCLCDACYRHVDRRANCPSYRKRPLKMPAQAPAPPPALSEQTPPPPPPQLSEKPISPPLDEESDEDAAAPTTASGRPAVCHTEGCTSLAVNSIRRKWLIKMRSSVNKVLKLEGDYPGLHTLPLCSEHYRALSPLMACALCRRRITKHHNVHFINHAIEELNPLLQEAGVPVQFTEKPVLCKLCRYYCLILVKPPGQNDKHRKSYRRWLLQMYNIEVPPLSEAEGEDVSMEDEANSSINKQKKKTKSKSKQRKSTEYDNSTKPLESGNDNSSDTHGQEKMHEAEGQSSCSPMEEDIESLISSNKIMVPGAKGSSSGSDAEGAEGDAQQPHVDKQTELQYLLQKQNNPAQFLHKPAASLTVKQKNILKMQSNMSIITKPGQNHRINEKNAKRIQKLGQQIVAQMDKPATVERTELEIEVFDPDKAKEAGAVKNISLNDECTIETIPNKRPADINTLKNKWQMSESFSQVKKNLSELSKKLTVDKVPKKTTDSRYSNPVKRLETNPSISVRELFPGEEEMNLQCNIEFNNVKGVTPEGWEKCNTTLQYDGETRKLWDELQRPYGNQSSFLRHLVILEKYFRSGDLVLSPLAAPHAASYSESVQSRLRAYDNVAPEPPRRSEPAISLIEFRRQKPCVNGKSLLKSNQTKKAVPGALKVKGKESKKSKALPPELIAINPPQKRQGIQNVLQNIQQLVKGVSAADPTEVASAPLPLAIEAPPAPLLALLPPPPALKKSETPKKQKTTSKPWRPTLMPITQENLEKINKESPQVAIDGRRLPSLVQVMSSGKRYHITLQDYNKMCVMRREKLQQLTHDGDGRPKRPSTDVETLVTELQPSALLGNGGTLKQSVNADKNTSLADLGQMGNAATILKNVGLKNITIAPIPSKTATVTSATASPSVSSPSLVFTPTAIKMPQLGSAVTITSEAVLAGFAAGAGATLLPVSTSMVMPKIPKSLTVIPQSMMPGASGAGAGQGLGQGAATITPATLTAIDSSKP